MARIENRDLLVLNRVDPSTGKKKDGTEFKKNGFVLRVVQWVFEDKEGAPKGSVSFEKRETYMTDEGEVRNGKAKGFTLDDLASLKAGWVKVIEAMKNAPAPSFEKPGVDEPPKESGEAAGGPEEDVPF